MTADHRNEVGVLDTREKTALAYILRAVPFLTIRWGEGNLDPLPSPNAKYPEFFGTRVGCHVSAVEWV